MNATGKLFPLFVVSLGILWLGFAARTPAPPESGYRLVDFGLIPVQENGRLMPFDTFARTKLMFLSHRQNINLEIKDKAGDITTRRIPAIEWALDTMVLKRKENNPVHDMHAFRIDNDQILDLLELKPSPTFGLFFKLDDFIENPKFWKEVDRLRKAGGPKKGDIYETKVAELWQKVQTVYVMADFRDPKMILPKPIGGQALDETNWLALSDAVQQGEGQAEPNAVEQVAKLLIFYSTPGKIVEFNRALDSYFEYLNQNHPDILKRNRLEVFFNHFAPYYQCSILFVVAALLACFSWIGWSKPLRQAAWGLGLLTLIVYTWTLYVRIHLSGYAPVTNLYSSAVFIGWGCALLCLMLELVLRNGIGTIVAAVTGTIALIIAHNLMDGDTMGKVVAVLESNFWLSTHVICITLGYTATFVAGFLGIVYVFLGVFTPILRRESGVLLGKVIYGVVCFAMFLSFVGTVLGGIWADQSWGRFWGWDPKENGALLIVIWNAIILHARWAGMVKPRGVALLAIAGNVVTAWSWFGTNLLGVGLHSYGFMQGAMLWLVAFAAMMACVIAVGLIPQRSWVSFRSEP